ncbi:5-methylcytosine-specific restriction protein B [Kordia periserrulae]|uniref:5-methylcytosine-specific restriction protein B n=1 Tax=Kordia periserrulae TaxID=701523 RepID=A0A2T6C474_9FLAO|nr:AAA family ATPase [Kordia periserrulae]PTX63087.1 5-methylcytosine-specific restriction protein B [Kordia periserrulae]
MEKYTWIPFFEELEQKIYYLRKYRNRDKRLIDTLEKIDVEVNLEDKYKGQSIELKRMDPFTFLEIILLSGFEKRKKAFETLRTLWNIKAISPSDFNGLQSISINNKKFFPYKDDRRVNDVNNLWLLFEQLHLKKIESQLFSYVCNIKYFSFERLTHSFFLYAPKYYFPVTPETKLYLSEKYGLSFPNENLNDYLNYIKYLSSNIEKPFYVISHEAQKYNEGIKNQIKINEEETKPWSLENFKNEDDGNPKPWSMKKENKKKNLISPLPIEKSIKKVVTRENRKKLHAPEGTNVDKNYYSVGFHWDGDKSQYDRFIKEGIWENGYDDKFSDVVNTIEIGDQIALKTAYTKKENGKTISATKIYNVGTVTDNPKDGKTVKVDWQENFEPYELIGKGVYRKTINKIQDTANIDLIFNHDQNQSKISSTPPSLGVDVGDLALNTILYGPPGTGKTYKLQNEYFPLFTTQKEQVTRQQYVENIIDELKWWEVIALALLDLGRPSKVAEIKRHEFIETKNGLSEIKSLNARLWSQLQTHTIEESATVNTLKRSSTNLIFDKTEDSFWFIVEKAEELTESLEGILSDIKNFTSQGGENRKRYKFVSFHQSFSYEDFMEGIKPVMLSEDEPQTEVAYEIQKGAFKQLCELAEKDPNNPYALFIDEINRGNISNIFGELITLIEKDKRKGEANELSLHLTYSKKLFSVPKNVYIIGTMNTADRSVEALDNALRRRFAFVEMMPDYEVLQPIEGISTKHLLETINKRLIALLDREHQIGHSYFIGLNTVAELMETFNKKIIPLLQEYFYNDYDKIGMVLGNGFIKRLTSDVKFAQDYASEEEYELNPTYKLVYHHDEEEFRESLTSAGLLAVAINL